jgi:hypothetical protein
MILECLAGWEAWKPQLQAIHTTLPQHVGLLDVVPTHRNAKIRFYFKNQLEQLL